MHVKCGDRRNVATGVFRLGKAFDFFSYFQRALNTNDGTALLDRSKYK